MRRFFTACCVSALVLAARLGTAALIPVSNQVDMAYDDLRGRLYISTVSNGVLRYDVATSQFLTPFPIIGSLRGIDVSADGRWLAVGDYNYQSTSVWFHLVDLVAETNSKVVVPRASSEGSACSVAFDANGWVHSCADYGGSTWIPWRKFDPLTGMTGIVDTLVYMQSVLAPSGDRRAVAQLNSGLSDGGLKLYETFTGRVTRTGGTGYATYDLAAGRNGRRFAAPHSVGTFLFDSNLVKVATLGSVTSRPHRVAFHPTRDALFCPWYGTSLVRVFDAYSLAELGAYDAGLTFTGIIGRALTPGTVRFGRSNDLVFVMGYNAISWFTNEMALPRYNLLEVSGSPVPAGFPNPAPYGTNAVPAGEVITNQVDSPAERADILYESQGATVQGVTPLLSDSYMVVFTSTNDARVTWNWSASRYRLQAVVAGPGSLLGATNGWYLSNDVVALTAQPAPGAQFVRWVGAVPTNLADQSSITVTMGVPRRLTALFRQAPAPHVALAGDWPTLGRDAAHSGRHPGSLGPARFAFRWKATVTGYLNQAAASAGRVFVTANNNRLTALDAASGSLLWTRLLGTGGTLSPPTLEGGGLFVQQVNGQTNSRLFHLDAATGATNWIALHSAASGYLAPVVADGKVWHGGGATQGLMGWSRASGAALFSQALEPYDSWTPAWLDGQLASHVGSRFRVHNPTNGATAWDLDMGAWPQAGTMLVKSIALAPHRAVVAHLWKLNVIDLDAHSVLWSAAGVFQYTPAVADGLIYVTTNLMGATCISLENGSYVGLYTLNDLVGPPIVAEDIVITSANSSTRIFDRHTRAILQTLPAGGQISLADGMLFVANTSGEIYAYEARYALEIDSQPAGLGTPAPQAFGTNWIAPDAVVTNTVASPYETNRVRYAATGWSLTGVEALAGSLTGVTFAVTNNAHLTWQWAPTHYQMSAAVGGAGAVTGNSNGWYAAGAPVVLTAEPAPGSRFVRWAGDLPPAQLTNATVQVDMTQPRRMVAIFRRLHGDGVELDGDWPTFGRSTTHSAYVPGHLGEGRLTLRWSTNAAGSVQNALVTGAGRVYYTTSGGAEIAALDAETGIPVWKKSFAGTQGLNPPSFHAGGLFVQEGESSAAKLRRLDAATGVTNWEAAVPTFYGWPAHWPPCIADGRVYTYGGYFAGIYGHNEASGAQDFLVPMEYGPGWTPAYTAGRLFTFVGPYFRENNPVTGTSLWTVVLGVTNLSYHMTGRNAVLEGTRAFCNTASNLYAVDVDTHSVVWQEPGPFAATPAVADGLVYTVTSSGLVCHAAANGVVAGFYRTNGLLDQPIVLDDQLLVATSARTLVFDLDTFAIRQTLPVGGLLSLANRTLFIGSGTALYAYEACNPFTVQSDPPAVGRPVPNGFGTYNLRAGSVVTNGVTAEFVTNGIRYALAGWSLTGVTATASADTWVTLASTNPATLTWRWREVEYLLRARAEGPGTILNPAGSWHASNAVVTLTAQADAGQRFLRWAGDVAPGTETQQTIQVTMERPHRVAALFAYNRAAPVQLAGEWPSFGNGPEHRGYFAGTIGAGRFGPLWTVLRTGEVKQVAVAEGRVHAASGTGSFSALDATNGTLLWHRSLSAGLTQGAPTVRDGTVYVEARHFTGNGTLNSFRAADGATNWVAGIGLSEMYGSPVVSGDGVFFVAGGPGPISRPELVCHERSNGVRRFDTSLEDTSQSYSLWTPAMRGGRLFRFAAGTFAEHDPASGGVLWSIYTGWPAGQTAMRTSVALGDELAYYAARTNLVAVDMDAKSVLWRAVGSYLFTPALANGQVYAVTPTGIEARVALTGDLLQFYPMTNIVDQPLVVDDTLIAAAATETKLFDLQTGGVVQTIPFGGRASVANAILYLATPTGPLKAYRIAPPPELSGVPSNTVASCGDPLPWPQVTATGACDAAALAVATQEVVSGSCPTLVTRVWTTTDACGNSAVATQLITLVDTAPPALVGVPTNLILMCGDVLSAAPSVTAVDACGTASVVFAESAATGCPGVVTRVWSTADSCGNAAAATQVVTFVVRDADGDGLDYLTEVGLGTDPNLADTDGDGRSDGREVSRGFNPLSGTNFPPAVRNDFNGDGESDLLVYHPASATWYALRTNSAPASQVVQWGWSAAAPVLADFDGDAIVDITIYHAAVGDWYVRRSATATLLKQNWGWSEANAAAGDYDGDGKADFAVYHQQAGNWYIRRSSNGSLWQQSWGWSEARSVPGDYDGDRKMDIAVYHPAAGAWYIRQSSSGTLLQLNWGWSAAAPVPGDYDGDGKTDLAVYHQAAGDWYIRRSSDGTLLQQNWGWSEAVPAPADYDHDGKTDLAVYHPAAGAWYIRLSSNASTRLRTWGWSEAGPVLSP